MLFRSGLIDGDEVFGVEVFGCDVVLGLFSGWVFSSSSWRIVLILKIISSVDKADILLCVYNGGPMRTCQVRELTRGYEMEEGR